jgi:hypothetical protein
MPTRLSRCPVLDECTSRVDRPGLGSDSQQTRKRSTAGQSCSAVDHLVSSMVAWVECGHKKKWAFTIAAHTSCPYEVSSRLLGSQLVCSQTLSLTLTPDTSHLAVLPICCCRYGRYSHYASEVDDGGLAEIAGSFVVLALHDAFHVSY